MPHDACVWAPADVVSESGGAVVAKVRAPADDEPLNKCASVETTVALTAHADALALPTRNATPPDAVEDLVALDHLQLTERKSCPSVLILLSTSRGRF